jgi:hypothetical protein
VINIYLKSKKYLLPIGDNMTKLSIYLCFLIPIILASHVPAFAPLPNPVLFLTGQEPFASAGKQFIRYKYAVLNAESYPKELFAASPTLPPCGANIKSSRTWVDIFDQRGKRLYGFCALGKPDDLSRIWFDLDADVIPPSYVYIEMNDRQTNIKYKSNLADTTL